MAAEYNTEKMYTLIKGFAMGREWTDTIAALPFARAAHKEQKRKSGLPYIIHPLTMACHAISLGIAEDALTAACLLHDVPEDCGVRIGELPVSADVREAVRRLTHIKGEPLEPYYREIREHRISSMGKLLDRCDNVSTMAGVFSTTKQRLYIQETRDFVLPLVRSTKEQWPEYGNALFVINYHIRSVIDGQEQCLDAAREEQAALKTAGNS